MFMALAAGRGFNANVGLATDEPPLFTSKTLLTCQYDHAGVGSGT